MGEKNLNFNIVVDRRNTRSLKYDFAEERGRPKDILPLWVADMDFRTSSYIIEALTEMSAHGIFGYSEATENYFSALKNWMKRRHGWEINEKWLVKTPGVVFALAMAVKAYTKENEAVLIQQPVYYPFANIIENNNRKLVINELKQRKDGKYYVDFEDFENKIVEEDVKLFFLCNPHNPVGRVWTEEELRKMGDICLKHHVLVVSDEIHADFVFKHAHTVFTKVREEYKDIGIVCTSPSKTFNIAGLQVSNIFIANHELRRKFRKQVNASGYSQLNLPGLVACEAAYQHGDTWLDAVLQYIKKNAEYVDKFLKERLPKVKMTELEGTYLLWLDFRAYGLSDSELNQRIIHNAGLWLDRGSMFGKAGEGFQRINIACPRSVLTEALEKLASAFEDIGKSYNGL
ncbi:MAG: pyridoxal phosphate-dependent aminotransferase [Tyzzerella sp.]|nr:pyridoxal phosphate-dependent aminotransferase [Tyzzerella sp.]